MVLSDEESLGDLLNVKLGVPSRDFVADCSGESVGDPERDWVSEVVNNFSEQQRVGTDSWMPTMKLMTTSLREVVTVLVTGTVAVDVWLSDGELEN